MVESHTGKVIPSHYSRNLLLRLALGIALVPGLIYLAREPLTQIYLRNQLTDIGLLVNGLILTLFISGLLHMVATLWRYGREEQALAAFVSNLRNKVDAVTDGVLRDSLVHHRYDQILVLTHQQAPIDHSALAATLVASESTRVSYPRFVNNTLILTGVFGTIISLSIALLGASDLLESSADISGMGLVIHGMSTALSTTLTAILCYLFFGYFFLRFNDVQTRIVAAIEETTTLHLLPRYNVSSDGLLGRVADLVHALRDVADQMAQTQRDQVSLEQRLDEINEHLRQSQKDHSQQTQKLFEAVERHDARMWRIARDTHASRKLLREGFRLSDPDNNESE